MPEIADLSGASQPTVRKWLDRYDEGGLEALTDRTSTGRPPVITAGQKARLLALTRQSPPQSTGLTHWSSRELAKWVKRHEGFEVSHNFIAELWRQHDLKPHRTGTFKLSKDPEFAAKVADVVGLYLDPPAGAVVLSVDEKSQIQALDRTQPMLPLDYGKTVKHTHDYVRHGTTNLFAALDVLTGQVIGRCFDRRRTREFLRFMNQVVAANAKVHAGAELHVIVDNLSTHQGDEVDAWLAKHPNVTFHFTPTGSSWLNQVENWFGIATRQAITRGTDSSVRTLVQRITHFIEHWNQDAEPFAWTATAEEILAKVELIERDYRKYLANNTS